MQEDVIDKIAHVKPRNQLILIALLMGAVPLATALVSQYVYHLNPCHLCVLQRVPYAIMAVLMVLLWRIRTHVSSRIVLFCLWICVCALLVDAGLAVYHVAVEQQWVSGPGGCTAQSGAALTLEQLKAQIMGVPIAMCDNPSFYFLGLTMAAWNVVYALVAAIVLVVLTRRWQKESVL